MKLKASELRKSLLDKGLSESDADVVVQANVQRGEAEDDIGDAALAIDVSAIDAFAKALSGTTPLAGADDGADDLQKARDQAADDGGGDLVPVLEAFAAAQDKTLERLDGHHGVLGDGLLAVGQVTKELAKALERFDGRARAMDSLLAEVRDRLGEPRPPRAVEGADDLDIQRKPGSEGVSKGKFTAAEVQRLALDEVRRAGTSKQRQEELRRYVTDLQFGHADPNQVAQRAGLARSV